MAGLGGVTSMWVQMGVGAEGDLAVWLRDFDIRFQKVQKGDP